MIKFWVWAGQKIKHSVLCQVAAAARDVDAHVGPSVAGKQGRVRAEHWSPPYRRRPPCCQRRPPVSSAPVYSFMSVPLSISSFCCLFSLSHIGKLLIHQNAESCSYLLP